MKNTLSLLFLIMFIGCKNTNKNESNISNSQTSINNKDSVVIINDSTQIHLRYDETGLLIDSLVKVNEKKQGLAFSITEKYKVYTTFVDDIKNGPAWKEDNEGKLLTKCYFVNDLPYGGYYYYYHGKLTQYAYIVDNNKKFIILYGNSKVKSIKGSPVISHPINIISKNSKKTIFRFGIELAIPDGLVMDVIIRYPSYANDRSMYFKGLTENIYYTDTLPTKPNYDFKLEYYLLDTINRKSISEGELDWLWDNIPNEDSKKKIIQT